MRPALVIFCYCIAVAWVLPGPLQRLSGSGVSPRLAIVTWLSAMASVLACAVTALWLVAREAIAGWPVFARSVCESVSAGSCSAAVYRSAAFELGLAITAVLGGLAISLAGWRYGLSLRRASVRTRAHAEAARITGHPAGNGNPAFVLDVARPAVYCVPGRPPVIVLTTGALAVLDPQQLTAVLAHERAHLTGRHHLLIALTRSLAVVASAVPLFARGASEVAKLAEMTADDIAARRRGRDTLLAALLAMSAGAALAQAPGRWLAATGGAVTVRVRRLAQPPDRARRMRHALALAAFALAIAAAAAWVPVFAVTVV